MNLRYSAGVFALGVLTLAVPTLADKLPSDVSAKHWAGPAVQSVLRNHVLELQNGKFSGDAKVNHTQAIIALAKVARALEGRTWMKANSVPIPANQRGSEDLSWAKQPVSRYVLANILARVGDYVANGSHSAPLKDPTRGKSEVMAETPKVTLSAKHPAYQALTYLVAKKMIAKGSPLQNPDDKPLTSMELSTAVSQMVIGVNNQLIDLGKEADGTTPDRSFHQPKKR